MENQHSIYVDQSIHVLLLHLFIHPNIQCSSLNQIMKEWSDLEERYQDLRAKDPRGAEEFKHRMTQRFQQTVEAVEAENEAEKHQLTALHQQRIVAHINEMKREAMTCYTRALAEKQPNVSCFILFLHNFHCFHFVCFFVTCYQEKKLVTEYQEE